MIQEIRIKNFLSFKEETVFSMEAVEGDDLDLERQTVEVAPGVRILRFAALYGANASGKTNFFKALNALHSLSLGLEKKLSSYPKFEFCESEKQNPTSFGVTAWIEDWEDYGKFHKCEYSIEFTRQEILSEKFLLDGEELFTRTNVEGFSKISFSEKADLSEKAKGYIEFSCPSHITLLNVMFNANIPERMTNWAIYVIMKFVQNFAFAPVSDTNGNTLSQNLDENFVLDVFRQINFEVTDIRREINPWGESVLLFTHTTEENGQKQTHTLNLKNESVGTVSFMNVLSELSQFLKLDQPFIVCLDEPDNSLHFLWFKYLIEMFLDKADKHCQLLITTHNAELLDCINRWLRADSIWFVNKDSNTLASEMYSLVEFNGFNDISYPSKAYLNGCFGAIPNIDK